MGEFQVKSSGPACLKCGTSALFKGVVNKPSLGSVAHVQSSPVTGNIPKSTKSGVTRYQARQTEKAGGRMQVIALVPNMLIYDEKVAHESH